MQNAALAAAVSAVASPVVSATGSRGYMLSEVLPGDILRRRVELGQLYADCFRPQGQVWNEDRLDAWELHGQALLDASLDHVQALLRVWYNAGHKVRTFIANDTATGDVVGLGVVEILTPDLIRAHGFHETELRDRMKPGDAYQSVLCVAESHRGLKMSAQLLRDGMEIATRGDPENGVSPARWFWIRTMIEAVHHISLKAGLVKQIDMSTNIGGTITTRSVYGIELPGWN